MRSRTRRRHDRSLLMLIMALAIVLPGALFEARGLAVAGSSDVPPALDRFLASVAASTPATARILIAGAPAGLTFYRATSALYPRVVYSALPTDYAHSQMQTLVSWAHLRLLTRRHGARYLLLWNMRPGGQRATSMMSVRAQSGLGTLVEVKR